MRAPGAAAPAGHSAAVVTHYPRLARKRPKAGVRRIVKFSGAESSVGFNQRNFRFTRMHEDIERYLEGSGLAWTHLRVVLQKFLSPSI